MSRRHVLSALAAVGVLATACEYVSPVNGNPSVVAVATDARFCWDYRAERPADLVVTWGDGGAGTVLPIESVPGAPAQGTACDDHRWGREGTYVVDAALLPVDSPLATVDSSVVVVGDPEPIVVAPAPVRATTLTLDATGAVVDLGADPHTAIVDWDFGDGVVAAGRGRIVTHLWEIPGPFTVTVTVRDADGSVRGSLSQQVVIGNR